MITPKTKWLSLCFSALAILLSSTAYAAQKPNILMIWGDDIGTWNLSAYNLGGMGFRTPNIQIDWEKDGSDRFSVPALIFPGQRTNAGTRKPPSQVVFFSP